MRTALVTLAVLALEAVSAADRVSIRTARFEAALAGGVLAEWVAAGETLAAPGGGDLCGILRAGAEHWVAQQESGEETLSSGETVRRTYRDLAGLPGSTLVNEYALDGGDLVVTQRALSPEPGVHGVQWGIGRVPLDCDILLPAHGGIRLRASSPGTWFQFEYPISWEAQFVVVEGRGRGLMVWADDPAGRYKRVTVRRSREGWQLGFATQNNAPFAGLTECTSVRWHVSPWEGDWRVPARQYREWAARAWGLTPRAEQSPAWARDIRVVVTMGQEAPVLEALAGRVDPRQTLLYLPNWRKFGYDRMYPDYTPNDSLAPFLAKARALGFRVMLHVNYFGCDPLSPEYGAFEKYQVRNPWTHEREWWLWERAEPPIKFAYINPACKAWRDLQIARWTELVARTGVDALHLDQTLCIFNDDNGLIDGMTMLEGNLALHRELRAALPETALSGEGLDEVTMRFEAFAQRHSYGLDFVEGTWDRARLAMAHPIAAFVFNPFTQPYGYLGMASPANDQVYAAWRENYAQWGVLPTFSHAVLADLEAGAGFVPHCLAEAERFCRHRLDPDFEGPWPAEVCFPYRGADGAAAAYRRVADGTAFVVRPDGGPEETVTRVLTGVTRAAGPGSIPGWRYYDEESDLGLDPEVWYPWSASPRDQGAFHVRSLPQGFTVSRVTQTDTHAVVEIRDTAGAVPLAGLMDRARCGSQPFGWEPAMVEGPLTGAEDGASFSPQGRDLHAHPPWKARRRNPRTGELEKGPSGVAFAAFPVQVPAIEGAVWFRTEVAMDKGAVGEGKTDGVLYRVRVEQPDAPGDGGPHAEVLNATGSPMLLELDLSPFRGREVGLVLEVDPGPRRDPTFDWARWRNPRVEIARRQRGTVGIVAPPFATVLCSSRDAGVEAGPGRLSVTMDLPGAVTLLREPPRPVSLPLDLWRVPFLVTFTSASGRVLARPQYASAGPGEGTVGGVRRAGLLAHPPDHGLTIADFPMVIPAGSAVFRSFVGLRDGSKSEGCGFVVKVNGVEAARAEKRPGEWSELRVDLSAWAGMPVLLSLVTDSEGSFGFDWAVWGEPRILTE